MKMSCVYFVLWLPEDEPCISAAFVKALPILSLIWFVCLQGISGDLSHSYNRKILLGLVFSCCGDISLIWQNVDDSYFILGLACFLIAHIFYTLAFKFTPFGLKEFLVLSTLAVTLFSIVLPMLSGPILYAVLVYGLLLWLMSWRSLARFSLKGDIPWRKIFAACGAILFVVSDSVLAVNKFVMPLPWERQVSMTTYYAAQLCLSLSVVNSRLSSARSHDDCKGRNTSCSNGHTSDPMSRKWIWLCVCVCVCLWFNVSTELFISMALVFYIVYQCTCISVLNAESL